MVELYVLRIAVPILLIFILIIWYKKSRSEDTFPEQVMHLEIQQEEIELEPAGAMMEPESDHVWLARLRETVRENLGSPQFNVDHLAELMGVSRTALYRLAQEKARQSPNQLIQEMRLLKAHELLESRQYTTLQQVSDAVGFRSTDYFSRLYRAHFGHSPVLLLKK